MSKHDFATRRDVAMAIRRNAAPVAERVTEEFLFRHPDWTERYGDAARKRGLEDAAFHLEFLAAAIESDSTSAFADYARWTSRVLQARGIAPQSLVENLEQLNAALVDVTSDNQLVAENFKAGVAAALDPIQTRGATTRSVYLQAILGGQRTAALNICLEMLSSGFTVRDVYVDVIQEAQYEIGRLWENNEISVSREHMATAITQFIIAQLYSRIDRSTVVRGNAILSGVSGELHQLGANMMADMLECDGWDVRFLGTQMPPRDILVAIDEHQPKLLGLSATMLFNLHHVEGLIEDVRKTFGGKIVILVGGGAFCAQPDVWREIGADGFGRDLREGIEQARALA